MNISLLSGAYKNAGDFLIVDRTKKLLQHVYPNCTITEYERRAPLEEHLEAINNSDCLLLAGGPAYQPNIYPDSIPLTKNLDSIKVPIFTIGLGWKGLYADTQEVYRYRFSDTTLQLLLRIQQDGLPLSCRDRYSMSVLKNNGISRCVMTGCPAWYNLEYLTGPDRILTPRDSHICISDPAFPRHFHLAVPLIEAVRKKYPDNEVVFVFHRGTGPDANTPQALGESQQRLKESVSRLGVRIVDASYGVEGLKVYNNCFFHIGFRVHAHIYNLSQGNFSILVDEDARGAGVNEIMGLRGVKTYNDYPYKRSLFSVLRKPDQCHVQNPFFMKQVEELLEFSEEERQLAIAQSRFAISSHFHTMVNHISNIAQLV